MALTIRNVTHWFDKSHILFKNLSIHLTDGDILLVKGPNGCGKTTLLRILATLVKVREGEVLLDDRSLVANFRKTQSDINFAFAGKSGFYELLTGEENLQYFFKIKRPKLPYPISMIKNAAYALRLRDELGKQVRLYSSGMKQKLSLIRALCTSPRLLILDEPTTYLDKGAVVWLEGTLAMARLDKKMVTVIASPEDDPIFQKTHTLPLVENSELAAKSESVT